MCRIFEKPFNQPGDLGDESSRGQVVGGDVLGAEISFQDPVTGGLVNVEAEVDSTAGTCQSIVG